MLSRAGSRIGWRCARARGTAERKPEQRELGEAAQTEDDEAKLAETRVAALPGKMRDGHFYDPPPARDGADCNQNRRRERRCRKERAYIDPDRAAEKPERDVCISHLPANEQRDYKLHKPGEREPMAWIAPRRTYSEDEVCGLATLPETTDVCDDELAVGVKLEYPVAARFLESSHHRRSMTYVPICALDLKPRPSLRELSEDRGSRVGRGVVDDDHLHVSDPWHYLSFEAYDELLDRALLVVDGHDD